MKPRTGKEINDWIRARGHTATDLEGVDMNDFIRSGGVIPEKKPKGPKNRPLTPDEAHKVLTAITEGGETFAAAKARVIAETEAANVKPTMNDLIRSARGQTTNLEE